MNHEKIEGWSERFDEAVRNFGFKYSSDIIPDAYGVNKSFLDAQFKELFRREIKKEKEKQKEEITSAEQRGEERERERITKWENLLIYFAQLIDIRTGHHSQQDVDANTVKELLTAITSRNQE